MSEHAKLSASSAHRWLACPPSVRLCDGIADTSSIYAAEGTLAHAVAELKLKKYFYPPSVKDYKAELETLKQKHIWQGESLWQKEMDGYSDFYVEYITNLCLSKERAPHVALEKRVDFSIWAPEGFGTADCVVLSDDVAHVIDLKYGKGVVVDAENNPQLMLYALGVYETYKILYGIKTFVLTIVQPRLDSISTWEIGLGELLAWGESIKVKAQLAYEGKGAFQAGEHCKFCKVKATCRARAQENIKLAGFTKALPDTLSSEELGEFLKQGKFVADWLKDLEEYALTECLSGHEVSGWKAVEGVSRRTWTDGEKAFQAIIASGIDEAMLYERKPLSLAQVEKLLGKKEFAPFSAFVYKPPGKPTLVEVTDKRKAISNVDKATEIFEMIGDSKNE